jgi:RNA methyltransferase, TrmH family
MAPLRGQPVALVVGNETDGISAGVLAEADLVVRIPMAGAVESLNVGVATGISIDELRMRMVLACRPTGSGKS